MFREDMADRLPFEDQRADQFIQFDQFVLRQVDPFPGFPEFFPILPVCVVCIVQILVEQTAARLAACIAHVRRLLLDLTGIVHEIRTPLITGIALPAGDPALARPLLSAYVALSAAVPVLAAIPVESLIDFYRFEIAMFADLLRYGIR